MEHLHKLSETIFDIREKISSNEYKILMQNIKALFSKCEEGDCKFFDYMCEECCNDIDNIIKICEDNSNNHHIVRRCLELYPLCYYCISDDLKQDLELLLNTIAHCHEDYDDDTMLNGLFDCIPNNILNNFENIKQMFEANTRCNVQHNIMSGIRHLKHIQEQAIEYLVSYISENYNITERISRFHNSLYYLISETEIENDEYINKFNKMILDLTGNQSTIEETIIDLLKQSNQINFDVLPYKYSNELYIISEYIRMGKITANHSIICWENVNVSSPQIPDMG